MRMTPARGVVCAALVAALALPLDALAGGIIFKDGFVVRGRVKREGDSILDPASGQQIQVGKGYFMVDDGVRKVVFSLRQVQDVIEDDKEAGADFVVLTKPFARLANPAEVKWIEDIQDLGPFDDNWNREIKIVPHTGKAEKVRQQLVYLSPYSAVVNSRAHAFGSCYMTRELGPEVVRSLLFTHPDLRDKGKPDLNKRLRLARFLRQAGWYDESDRELDQLLKDLPSKEKEILDAKESLKILKADQLLHEIELAQKAGQPDRVRKLLARFPLEKAEAKQLARLRDLKAKHETAEAAVKAAKRYLKDVPALLSGDDKKVWEEAAAALLAEVNADNVERLEPFVKYAEQDEQQRKQQKKPTQTPEEIMALAVSGWHLGAGAAETKPEVALKLWRTRQFVRDYQTTPTATARERLLAAYEKSGAVAFDELAQLIRFLPPPEPEEKIAGDVLDLEAKLPNRRKAISYQLQLPPEYHVGRQYPVLIALGNADEKAKATMERWGDLAAQNGYLLVIPDWAVGLGRAYGYTTDEQAAVYDVLRDVQRRFNVDSDRVFLTGFGEGGVMAFDVGLSRPDLFAGVLPFCAAPRLFAVKYAPNAAHLPFYVVTGSLQGNDTYKQVNLEFDKWAARNYPSLWVEYRGRTTEWYAAEANFAFDWMNHKKRFNGVPETGEFQTQRTTDHRFYWLSVDGISEKCLNTPRGFNHFGQPATVQGKIGEGNTIMVHAKGAKTVTVWLGRGMVDFEKPVGVSINVQSRFNNRKLTPSLGTLLEDFYQRGDRLRLFLVKIELSV